MSHVKTTGWIFIGYLLFISSTSSAFATPLFPSSSHDFVISQDTSIADAETAASITSKAFKDVKNILRRSYDQNITQLNVTDHVDDVMRAEGSDGSLAFPTLLMAGDEWSWPYGHNLDDESHIVDPVHEPAMVVKAGARYNDQCVTVARTFFFETASQEMKDAYQTVLDTQEQVIAAVSPGINASSLMAIFESGLALYTNRSDVDYYPRVGFGLSSFAIDDPVLSEPNGAVELEEDQILVIRVFLYFDAGWLVRVDDSLVVTSTGTDVISDVPKSLADVTILSNSTLVDAEIDVFDYEYDQQVTLNVTINDSANRSVQSISFFDGKTWSGLTNLGNDTYQKKYIIDYTYPSHVNSLVRVSYADEVLYLGEELNVVVEPSYSVVLNPPIHVVVEDDPRDNLMSWVFTRPGAEMIRLHFSSVHPPAGDQFLIRDVDGNVVLELKWNLREEATTPWVPGNILYIEVQPQWKSIYGGVNHFAFTVDEIGAIDTEYVPPPTTTTPSSTPTTETTTTPTVAPTNPNGAPLSIDPIVILLGGVLVLTLGLVFILKRK